MLLAIVSLHAQVKERSSLTLSVGPSFPIGNFGDDDVSSNSAGLAKTGVMLELGYVHPITKYSNLVAMLHAQQNGLNTAALENAFSKTKIFTAPVAWSGTGVPPVPQGTVYPNWKFEKDHWRTASLLLGVQTQLPLASKGYFVGTALFGPAYASTPKINGKSTTDTATATASQSSVHAWGLGYLVSGGVRYNISSRIFLSGALNIFGTNKITFKNIKATLNTTKGNPSSPGGMQVSQSTVTANGKQSITTVNLAAGIGLRL